MLLRLYTVQVHSTRQNGSYSRTYGIFSYCRWYLVPGTGRGTVFNKCKYYIYGI